MFVVLLRFSDNKSNAGDHMDGHNAWLKQGFDDGVFVAAGSLKPKQGGAIIAHGVTSDVLMARVNDDPFVKENVVVAEMLEIEPAKLDERLEFLRAAS